MDCCSVILPKYEGLWSAFEGRGKNQGIIEGPNSSEQEEFCESGVFWQFTTSEKGEIAAAQAGNMDKLYRWCIKFSKQQPYNYISVPDDIS